MSNRLFEPFRAIADYISVHSLDALNFSVDSVASIVKRTGMRRGKTAGGDAAQEGIQYISSTFQSHMFLFCI
jgi:hypothetical protein